MSWTPGILMFGSQDYVAIRSLLEVTSIEVPDETIEQPPFLPAAEAVVKSVITDYASLTGDNAYLLKAGTQALTAALLCRAIERGDTEDFQVGGYREHGSGIDWRQKSRDLIAQAKGHLGRITTRTFTRPALLALSGPTRAGTRIPTDIEQWVERVVPRFIDWVEEGGEDDAWASP